MRQAPLRASLALGEGLLRPQQRAPQEAQHTALAERVANEVTLDNGATAREANITAPMSAPPVMTRSSMR